MNQHSNVDGRREVKTNDYILMGYEIAMRDAVVIMQRTLGKIDRSSKYNTLLTECVGYMQTKADLAAKGKLYGEDIGEKP